MRTGYSSYRAPKCPAIIFNNSGSMCAIGRVEKTMDIITDVVRASENGADYYISDDRTGIPSFVTHIADEVYGSHTAPLIPLITGEDYMNTMALAAIIEEYPAGVHIIDDGDGIGAAVGEALHLLKSMKNPAYMNPITLYIVRGQSQYKSVDRHYESARKKCPESSGFNFTMYHAIPQEPHSPTEWQPDKRLPY